MAYYTGTATRPDRAKAVAAVMAVHALLALMILTGLNVRMISATVERLQMFDVIVPLPRHAGGRHGFLPRRSLERGQLRRRNGVRRGDAQHALQPGARPERPAGDAGHELHTQLGAAPLVTFVR